MTNPIYSPTEMSNWWSTFTDSLAEIPSHSIVFAIILLLAGIILSKVVSGGLVRALTRQTTPHQSMLVRRTSYYLILGLFVISALIEIGFDMSLLLGAAGILTVALGFASQTSASNIISGLFLIGEKPFEIGEVIRIGGTTGEVISIDLLSVKLRTFDNLYVRIANENLIKSEITNLNRFPIRRVDLTIGLDYRQDLKKAMEVILQVADVNPLCLDEPKPVFVFQAYADSAINVQFSVWARQENFLEVRNAMYIDIKEAFDANGISIPFPQRTIHVADLPAAFTHEAR